MIKAHQSRLFWVKKQSDPDLLFYLDFYVLNFRFNTVESSTAVNTQYADIKNISHYHLHCSKCDTLYKKHEKIHLNKTFGHTCAD